MTAPPGARPLPPTFRRLPAREVREEILDAEAPIPNEDLVRTVEAMAQVNRRLGGTRSILAHLRPLARRREGAPLSVLDLGVGGGDVPRAVARALRSKGARVEWTGIDRDGRTLAVARGRGEPGASARLVRGDARRLPFVDDSFDVVISTLTLHHLGEADARAFLREAARVARERVIVSDLERHPLHYLGARVLGATLWRRDPVTRHDGPLSVLRAYTRREMAELAEGLPFREIEVRRHLPFRLVLDGRPG